MLKKIFIFILIFTQWVGCGETLGTDTIASIDPTTEAGQHLGEIMVSIDESGGSSFGAYAFNNELFHAEKSYARLEKSFSTSQSTSPSSLNNIRSSKIFPFISISNTLQQLLSSQAAQAATCSAISFSTCSSSSRIKNFSGCSLSTSTATITGNVTLAFTGSGAASCTFPTTTDAVTRTPNYTITGARGANFSVTAPNGGQTITKTVSGFSVTNPNGIRRRYATGLGNSVLDMTTKITSALTITGNVRTNRTITGGAILLTNNLNSVTCSLTPASVQWANTNCNCPTSGSWTGSCSTGETYSLTFTSSCGVANLTLGSTSRGLTLDRCTAN